MNLQQVFDEWVWFQTDYDQWHWVQVPIEVEFWFIEIAGVEGTPPWVAYDTIGWYND